MSAIWSPTCTPQKHISPHSTTSYYPPAQGNIHAGDPAPILRRSSLPQEECFLLHHTKNIFSCSITFVIPLIYCRSHTCPGNTTPFNSVMLLIWKTLTMTCGRSFGDVFCLMDANWHLPLVGSRWADANLNSFFSLRIACLLHRPILVSRWRVTCHWLWRMNRLFCLSRRSPLIFPNVVPNPHFPLIDALVFPQNGERGPRENALINVFTNRRHSHIFRRWIFHSFS